MSQRMPALYIGHGAPLLLDDPVWIAELKALAASLPKPKSILIVSAHWEAAPLMLGTTDGRTPLIYDFGGFDPFRWERSDRLSLRSSADDRKEA